MQPSAEDAAKPLAVINAVWQKTSAAAIDLLPTMTPGTPRDAAGIATLHGMQRLESTDHFRPPVTFRIVCLTQGNDIRVGYSADQIIFNWEMRPTELRVDGGPADRRYLAGAGALPSGEWAGVELHVTNDLMTIRVNGKEVYRTAADFSATNDPLRITAHVGSMLVKSVSGVRE